jgi:phosphoribosylamine--glycine ligase
MNILLVGSGGREHALAWKIAASPLCTRLVCAPGNPGMAKLGECAPVSATDVTGQLALARMMKADLVVIGPDAALEAGVADAMIESGIPVFGPTADAARIETSKTFSKDFATRHQIPTAAYGTFATAAEAKAYLAAAPGPPYVVKADGLTAGKGVTVAQTLAEAETAVDGVIGGRFGPAGVRVVIEEFMPGEEVSFFALSDGETAVPFGFAQDHKRAYDNDRGPNTGGMGAYSPAPVLTPALQEAVWRRMVLPAIAGMAAEGRPFRGALYTSLMLTPDGPKLVEFNARFGDPETQVLMLRLKGDLAPYLMACATGDLGGLPTPEFGAEAAIVVVLAAEGYPAAPLAGTVIEGAEADFGPDVQVFHAGAARRADGALIAAGGRVLNVCGKGKTLEEARARAYAAVDKIHWPQGFHRSDIGWRELARA